MQDAFAALWLTAWQPAQRRPGAIPDAVREKADYSERLLGGLSYTFELLSSEYGRREAADLYAWIRRQFIDQDQLSWWHGWSWLLQDLADVYGRGLPRIQPNLTTSRLQWIRDITSRNLSVTALESLDELIQSVKAEPPRRARPVQTTEQVFAFHSERLDLRPVLRVSIRAQRAFDVWKILDHELERDELQALVDWGELEQMAAARPRLPRTSRPHFS
jgi:hypothetical protein